MAYETGTPTDQGDLVQKILDFAATLGWTIDQNWSSSTRIGALHKNDLYVQFKTSPPDDFQGSIAVYQSLDWNAAQNVGLQPGDSGNGLPDPNVSTAVGTQRRISTYGPVAGGPWEAYHLFGDADAPYIHCVVEMTSNTFRHLSFGRIDKVGEWTGGEYCGAHAWQTDGFRAQDQFATEDNTHGVLLDSHFSPNIPHTLCRGTMRIEGFPNQGGSDRWGVFTTSSGVTGTDRAGNDRIPLVAGFRSNNFMLSSMHRVRGQPTDGVVPLIPIPVWWYDPNPNPAHVQLLGFAPDVRHVSMGCLSPGEEIQIGGETWKCFPVVRKQFAQQESNQESRNAGIAYKKVDT